VIDLNQREPVISLRQAVRRAPPPFTSYIRKRNVLRLGFGLVTALLAFSLFQAYQIQASLSEQTAHIYHRHIRQDDLLSRLRRTFWVGANLSRDYLVHPGGAGLSTFATGVATLRAECQQLLHELDLLAKPRQTTPELKLKIDEFWAVVSAVPDSTKALDAAGRYGFIQREIVPRRNAVGDVVRQFAELDQEALKQGELDFARTRREFARRLLLILGISLVFGVAVAVFSLVHSDALERQSIMQYEEVELARTELQQLSARLMEVQEEERARLSRELHDEIGQTAATLRLEIARAETLPPVRFEEIRERLARARALAGRVVQGVRDICVLLRPTMLDDLGLAPALQWQTEDFTRRTDIPCQLEEENVEDALPGAVKTCVYRVLQESLHNCQKHSSASNVRVSVRQSGNTLTMEIEDNGCGFEVEPQDQRARATHFGIMGMRERVTALEGTFELQSEPGKGTRIGLCIPVPAKNEAAATRRTAHAS
jgi:signal transduction histidine kinase